MGAYYINLSEIAVLWRLHDEVYIIFRNGVEGRYNLDYSKFQQALGDEPE